MPEHTGAEGPLFIVMNAGSGRNDADATREQLRAAFTAAGREHEFLLLDDANDLPKQAERAVVRALERKGVVVAAGGDGTLSGVADAVHGRGCSFAVLPQGTFNLFGRTHGIPQDTEAQARALLGAHVESVQVGTLNGRVFLVNASLGLYPEILEDREEYKKRFGRNRAVAAVSGVVTLLRHHQQLRLDIDTESERRQVRTPTLFVGNNRLQLERIGVSQVDELDRGRLVGLVVRPIRTRAMLGLAVRGALGSLGEAEHVHGFGFQRLTVQPHAQRAIKVALDGEVSWARTPLELRVAPASLPLLVPAAEDRAEVE